MRKRAEAMDRTRRRITEAAVRLHTTIGPAHTTISAIAKEAGVTRLTVYNHFSDEDELFTACSAHWTEAHPGPDPDAWRTIADPGERARIAFAELYGWYEANGADLLPIHRDLDAMPDVVRSGMAEADATAADALIHGTRLRGAARRRYRAVAGHLVAFQTWRSIAVEQELGTAAAVDLAVAFLEMCRGGV